MLNIAFLRYLSYQLDLMVDVLEIMVDILSDDSYNEVSKDFPSLLNSIIIEINECSSKIDKLIINSNDNETNCN